MLTHAPWRDVPGLRHGFLEAADCVAGPDWNAVVAAAGAIKPVCMPRLVHGVDVVDAPRIPTPERPVGDAGITVPERALVGVTTADCVPVLLLDRRGRAAAAVHAGWRGAAAGVIEATVARLEHAHGVLPGDLEAAIGPAIDVCCYEVGAEVRDAFVARAGSSTDPAWDLRGERPRLDLRGAVRLLLERAGVPTTALVGGCTRCTPSLHSFRRDGAASGRQLSFIGWA